MEKMSMHGCDLHDESGLVKWAVDRGTLQQHTFTNTRQAQVQMIRKLTADSRRERRTLCALPNDNSKEGRRRQV